MSSLQKEWAIAMYGGEIEETKCLLGHAELDADKRIELKEYIDYLYQLIEDLQKE